MTTTRANWRPSLGAVIGLFFLLVLSLSNSRLVLISGDGDAALHWRIGNWMLEHRQVIRTDHFSHTRDGAVLISKEWLSEVLYAAAGNTFGWAGVVVLAAGLIAATLWALNRLLVKEGSDSLVAGGVVLLVALASSHHWLARPHLFTQLFTVIFVGQLRAFERGEISAARLAGWLVPLMVVWTNLHGAFFTGFVVLGCFGLGNLRRREKFWPLLGIGAGCLAVSLLNPNGWKLHAQVIGFLRAPLLAGYAQEFRSPDFHSGGMQGFLLLLLVLVLVLALRRPRLRGSEMALLAVWGFFALRAVRNVPIFALVTAPILAEHLRPRATAPVWYARLAGRLPAGSRVDGTLLAVAWLALLVCAPWWPATAPVTDRFPVTAVERLRQEPDMVRGAMFNDYKWGGYLMLELPERKVFVDGRNDFYGVELMKEFETVDRVQPGWEEVFRRYDVRWTILPVAHPLNSLLALDANWEEAYRDEVTVIYRMASGSI